MVTIEKVDPKKIRPSVCLTDDNTLVFNRRARIVSANWDAMATDEIARETGFRITEPGKSDVDEEPGYHSIHSPLYGSDCNNEMGFLGIYQCDCGRLQGTYYADGKTVCPKCKTKVSFHEINMRTTGWIVMDRDVIIAGHMFRKVQLFIGVDRLEQILTYKDPEKRVEVTGNPFVGIGLVEFHERFDEIMDYYLKKFPGKLQQYSFLMERKCDVFTHSIPVYNMHLRHFMISDTEVKYSKADIIFKKIFTNITLLNNRFALQEKRQMRMERERRRLMRGEDTRPGTVERLRRENILMDVQTEVNQLWDHSFTMINTANKSGILRVITAGGRVNYIARCVIVKNVDLQPDEIGLGYIAFLELFQDEIIELLCEQYNMNIKQASDRWEEAVIEFDATVYEVMQYLITERTQYVDIWRNPVINYGSTMTMRIVNINPDTRDYCMELPPLILPKPNADMDGDIMNLQPHKDESIGRYMYQKQNPMDNMFISHNDGLFDADFNAKKDMNAIIYCAFNI